MVNGFFLGSVGSNESISQTAHHIELKRVESEIVEIKKLNRGESFVALLSLTRTIPISK